MASASGGVQTSLVVSGGGFVNVITARRLPRTVSVGREGGGAKGRSGV